MDGNYKIKCMTELFGKISLRNCDFEKKFKKCKWERGVFWEWNVGKTLPSTKEKKYKLTKIL